MENEIRPDGCNAPRPLGDLEVVLGVEKGVFIDIEANIDRQPGPEPHRAVHIGVIVHIKVETGREIDVVVYCIGKQAGDVGSEIVPVMQPPRTEI